ncbi:hypothetical protein [Pseudotabrizicola alkalilacus]|uniref:hypothetical protein n=1 Tax=Pseudotabrizicola alkalilacus TaxID=2305252 RepID=UPI0013147B1A|nr:hypothetical protein [Pseudotabrizicola alkalilacus]
MILWLAGDRRKLVLVRPDTFPGCHPVTPMKAVSQPFGLPVRQGQANERDPQKTAKNHHSRQHFDIHSVSFPSLILMAKPPEVANVPGQSADRDAVQVGAEQFRG